MSYDLEHTQIYKLIEDPVFFADTMVIGRRTTTISKTKGEEGFSICVNTEKSDMDRESTEVVSVTLPMLAAMR